LLQKVYCNECSSQNDALVAFMLGSVAVGVSHELKNLREWTLPAAVHLMWDGE
jgi:hypothetical protein